MYHERSLVQYYLFYKLSFAITKLRHIQFYEPEYRDQPPGIKLNLKSGVGAKYKAVNNCWYFAFF